MLDEEAGALGITKPAARGGDGEIQLLGGSVDIPAVCREGAEEGYGLELANGSISHEGGAGLCTRDPFARFSDLDTRLWCLLRHGGPLWGGREW